MSQDDPSQALQAEHDALRRELAELEQDQRRLERQSPVVIVDHSAHRTRLRTFRERLKAHQERLAA